MTQRAYASLLALVLLTGLFVAAVVLPLPYVVFSPGVTVDVLGKQAGKEIIQVAGHKTFRDDGQLRMTTIYLTQPDGRVTLWEAMQAWLSNEQAIYPRDAIYGSDETTEQSREQSAVQMVSSQDAATAVALRALGYKVPVVVEVLGVSEDSPADGKLEVRDVLTEIDGATVRTPKDLVNAVDEVSPGKPVEISFLRDGKAMTTTITPTTVDGDPRIGVVAGPGYDFPFQVDVNIDTNIGGPSAGLMFALGIYDTLSPGSLTDGQVIAGTGTMDDSGAVGPIGGIQQKIVAARNAGAELFLVPADNCADALGAPRGDMRLVRADTFSGALDAVQTWTSDHDATLPTCTAEEAS